MRDRCFTCGAPIPKWFQDVRTHLERLGKMQVWSAEAVAKIIHEALEIAEAPKYATDESQFILYFEGVTEPQLEEVRQRLTSFQNKIVVLEVEPPKPVG